MVEKVRLLNLQTPDISAPDRSLLGLPGRFETGPVFLDKFRPFLSSILLYRKEMH